MHAIEVEKVTKIYRKGFRAVRVPAVVDLSFTVRKAAITGFVGPNGAGKTTTIKMMTGLVFPTSGAVRIEGMNAADPPAKSGVAYLSEQPYFYSHLSVEEMLLFTAQLIKIPGGDQRREIARVLEIVQLADKGKLKIREMSKGMQQRLNMAQALLGRPHTLILDEPMSGMDPPGRRLFRSVMASLHQEGCTLFFSTHVLDDVESLCDDVVVLQQGKLTYAGAVQTLLNEGYLGTEIITGPLSATVKSKLENNRVKVAIDSGDASCSLFIDKCSDIDTVLQALYADGVYPRSVGRRSMTLEELLYSRNEGGGDR
jgi:ABC-2 type transport system ATP-binding protein